MKKFGIIMALIFAMVWGWTAEVKLSWHPPVGESQVAGYKLYQSTTFFETPPTNYLQDVGNRTNTTVVVYFNDVFAYHVTAYNSYGLESDPSNEIRFQLLTSWPGAATPFTLVGFTNWSSAILKESTTNGILSGTPPNLTYTRTNPSAFRDGFIYTVEKRPLVADGKNKVYTVMDVLTNRITIDGDLSEWPSYTYQVVNPIFYIPKNGTNTTPVTFEKYKAEATFTGTNDHSIIVKALRDAADLYLGVIVRDDYHENTNNSPWNGDAMQLLFADGTRTIIKGTINCGLGGRDGSLSNTIVSTFTPTNYPPSIAITRNSTTKITTYELRIPSAFIGTQFSSENAQFGLGICVNDGDPDAPGQGGWSGFGPHAIVFGQSPSETALFRLRDEVPVKNYYTIYYGNPNLPPVISDVVFLKF